MGHSRTLLMNEKGGEGRTSWVMYRICSQLLYESLARQKRMDCSHNAD